MPTVTVLMVVLIILVFFCLTLLILLVEKKPSVEAGQIVLYHSCTGGPQDRNMVTQVLGVLNGEIAVIRYYRTTMTVRIKDLQPLAVDKAFPLLVPEEPFVWVQDFPPDLDLSAEPTEPREVFEGHRLTENEKIVCHGNQAGFTKIPLNWCGYGVGFDKNNRVRVS